ncbi:hypothetical protein M8C21_006719 [Ambrosia artemisiifolia]|uniref:Uncharacterized protein n=1 Tax=Ambrosia artemisiifolia TaxID=4212 RepID=A0AAD5GEF1_AMBAR|nr:hypothetical protein M8C21_006719 [Ambrosia artemisiifolia]
MEEKQLDLNAPLLSVRRLSPARRNIDQTPCNSIAKSRPTRQQSLPASRSHWEPEQEVTKPAAIPFIWEQIPGQAKARKPPNNNINNNNTPNSPIICSPTNEQEEQHEDVHSDAFDILSMSYSCNNSEGNSDAESLTSFSPDYNTCEYLMARFIPAAKSMIVETPQYVAKKQEVIPEPPKYVKKVYSGELRPLLLEKYPVNSYNQESDKECVEVDDGKKKKKSRKGFGLFFLPRICTKRSSCMSNPMTGAKTTTKVHQSQSPVKDSPGLIPRLSRRTSYSGPLTPSVEKQAMDAVIKKTAESRPKEAHEAQHKSNPFTRTGNSLPSSPHRSLSRSGRSISPYRNESPRSPFHDGARFLGVPKDVQNRIAQPKTCPSLNVKSHFSPRLIHDSPPLVPEKTLYIDWNEKLTSPTPNEAKIEPSGDVDGNGRVPPLPKSPSESWLRRKMSLRSHFPKKMQPVPIEKSPKNGPKWETIVKTSNVHHDHVRYSEELLNVSKYPEISF